MILGRQLLHLGYKAAPALLGLGATAAAIVAETSLSNEEVHKGITAVLGAMGLAWAALWWFVKQKLEKVDRLPSDDWYGRVSKAALDDVPVLLEKAATAEKWRDEHREDDKQAHVHLTTLVERQQERLDELSDLQKDINFRGGAR